MCKNNLDAKIRKIVKIKSEDFKSTDDWENYAVELERKIHFLLIDSGKTQSRHGVNIRTIARSIL